jgi:hypothetical protein
MRSKRQESAQNSQNVSKRHKHIQMVKIWHHLREDSKCKCRGGGFHGGGTFSEKCRGVNVFFRKMYSILPNRGGGVLFFGGENDNPPLYYAHSLVLGK